MQTRPHHQRSKSIQTKKSFKSHRLLRHRCNFTIFFLSGGGKLHADKTPSSALKINTTGGQADGQHLSSSSTSIGSSATAPTSSSHKHSSSGSSASKSASKSAGKGSSSSESKSSKSESHHHRSSSHHSSSKSKSSQHERYLSPKHYYLYSCNKITKT